MFFYILIGVVFYLQITCMMKIFSLSLLIILGLLLTLWYALPVSPSMVGIWSFFAEEDNPIVCRIYEDMYYSYYYHYDSDALILKPFAHICLSAQLSNINLIKKDLLEAEVETMKEVYLLDIDNFDRVAYREKHDTFFQWLSSVSSEEEIYDTLISWIKRQRNILEDKYTKQYYNCASTVTEETDASSLSDEEWSCLKTSLKSSAKYYDRYFSIE